MVKTRISAFAIHLGISLLIFFVLAYLVVFQWYPDMFFDTDGGWRGMRIIVAVDLVLGPSLTLVVYRVGKPGLRTDLTLIGLLQVVCLAAGTYVVFSERPVAVVYNDGRFTVMSTDDYRIDANIDVPDFRDYPDTGPKWALVEVPEDMEAEADFRAKTLGQGRLIASMTENYIPFDSSHPQFVSQAIDPNIIIAKEGGQQALDIWRQEYGGEVEDYSFYIFSTRYAYGYLGFRRATGERLGLLTIMAY